MTSTPGGWLLCHGSQAKPRGESETRGGWVVSVSVRRRKGEGRLARPNKDWIIKTGRDRGRMDKRQREAGRNRSRGRSRSSREAGGKNLSIAAVCRAVCLSIQASVFLCIIFFSVPFC